MQLVKIYRDAYTLEAWYHHQYSTHLVGLLVHASCGDGKTRSKGMARVCVCVCVCVCVRIPLLSVSPVVYPQEKRLVVDLERGKSCACATSGFERADTTGHTEGWREVHAPMPFLGDRAWYNPQYGREGSTSQEGNAFLHHGDHASVHLPETFTVHVSRAPLRAISQHMVS